jgi:hypothetical protein
MRNDHRGTGRRLTYDELKAAEAAFQGYAFNENWSEAAGAVYERIVTAKMRLHPWQGMGVWGVRHSRKA